MVLNSENKKLDELSAELDAMNRGVRLGGGDQETRELAEVALLLKLSAPPPEIVNGLVEKLSGELTARKKRRRFWLTSGAAGSAAAALLVFALNLHPAAPLPPPLAIPPAGSVVIEKAPSPVQVPAAKVPEAPVSPDGQVPAVKPAPGAGGQMPAAKEQPLAAAPPEMKSGAQDRQASAPAKAMPAEKRVMMAERPSENKAIDTAQQLPVPEDSYLTWAGRQPDEVTVDRATGAVRQVYGAGGDQEIVITQRVTSRAAGDGQRVYKSAGFPETVDSPATKKTDGKKINRVTLNVKGYVVTVEGSQSKEELWKIAQSLE